MEPIEYQGSIEQFLCEKATVNHVPINAILELTPLCNMNCDMCFVRLSAEEMKQKGRLRSAEEWIGLGREMKEAGTLFVLFTGGEPLLHPEFKKIYVAYKRMGMILTVNTNGTMIDEQWADFFAEYPPRRINLTLYGKDEHTYQKLCHYPEGFGKALRAIQLLQERKVDVKINGSITPKNAGDIEELFSIVNQMDVVWKFDTYMYPASRERNHLFEEKSRMTPEEAAAVRRFISQANNLSLNLRPEKLFPLEKYHDILSELAGSVNHDIRREFWATCYRNIVNEYARQIVLIPPESVSYKGKSTLKIMAEYIFNHSLATVDHLDPKSKYNSKRQKNSRIGYPENKYENLVVMCKDCNTSKSSTGLGHWVQRHPEMISNMEKYIMQVKQLSKDKIIGKKFEFYPYEVAAQFSRLTNIDISTSGS